MPWLQLSFEASTQQIGKLEELLPALGAVAVTLEDNADQPLYEPPLGTTPLWENTRVVGLFDAHADLELVSSLLKPHFPEGLPTNRSSILEDQNWEKVWMDQFQPIAFGDRLWICPSWCKPPDPNAVNLLLDPGLAFGTGTHPTTALCLEWLDRHDLSGKTVIDYGCGSGILAIAAKLLGCETVWAVDNDPQALLACKDNAQKNQVADSVRVVSPEAFANEFTGKADLVLANILAGPLQQLAPALLKLIKPEGALVLSGILSSQQNAVQQAYTPSINFSTPATREEWVRLNGQLKL